MSTELIRISNPEYTKTKAIYFNVMNDIETFRLFLNTSHKDFLAWEKYNARMCYLEEVSEYLQVGPYAEWINEKTSTDLLLTKTSTGY